MKRLPLIFGCVGALAITGATLLVAGAAHPIPPAPDARIRPGMDAYYTGPEELADLPELSVNLKDSDTRRYLSVGIGVSYRLGMELLSEASKSAAGEESGGGHGGGGDARKPKPLPPPFQKSLTAVRDRLVLLLSNKTEADITGKINKQNLKEEIRAEIEAAVFPDQKGRIESVYLRQFLLQ